MPLASSSAVTVAGGGPLIGAADAAAGGADRVPASPSMVCRLARMSAVVYLSVFVVRCAGSFTPLTSW